MRDDGEGGADPGRGSGLAGIRRRVAALDGTTRIDSPGGEGTTLEVDLPCGCASVSKHIGAVLAKLGLPHTGSGHRRVLAVLVYLNS